MSERVRNHEDFISEHVCDYDDFMNKFDIKF